MSALSLGGSACGILESENRWEALERKLEGNRRRWERQEISSYSFVQSWICECIPYLEGVSRVWVEEGVITKVERISDGAEMGEEIRDHWYTVEDLFDFLGVAIEEEAAYLEVEFDGERGFPTRVEADVWADFVDDEKSVEVSGFRVEEG